MRRSGNAKGKQVGTDDFFAGLDETKAKLREGLKKARTKHGFHLWAWVVMLSGPMAL